RRSHRRGCGRDCPPTSCGGSDGDWPILEFSGKTRDIDRSRQSPRAVRHTGSAGVRSWLTDDVGSAGAGMTDAELVRRAREGERAAQEQLVRRYAPRLLAVCRARVGRHEAVEDLAQEALLRGLV